MQLYVIVLYCPHPKAFSKSTNKFFFLKTDIIKLLCDFKQLKAVLTCERNGQSSSLTVPLKDCFRVDSDMTNSAVSTVLELNLLDTDSYRIVEELKVSDIY
jgi:hypothetical protein